MAIVQGITVEYEELAGSPEEEVTDEGFRATRRLKCAWNDRLKLAWKLVGGYTGGLLHLGQSYEAFPLATVRRVGIAPFPGRVQEADDLREAAYEFALLTVVYETPSGGGSGSLDDRQEVNGELISEHISFANEFLTIPSKNLYYDSQHNQPLDEDASPGKLISVMTWEVTKHNLTQIPSAYKTLADHVNASTIKSKTLGMTFEPETLLYNGCTIRRSITADGQRTLDLTARFLHREHGWNKFYRPETDSWVDLYVKGNANPWKPFDTADLSALT